MNRASRVVIIMCLVISGFMIAPHLITPSPTADIATDATSHAPVRWGGIADMFSAL